MTRFLRKNLVWALGLVAVVAIVGSAAVAQILPQLEGPAAAPAGPVRPPLITPVRPPLVSPIEP